MLTALKILYYFALNLLFGYRRTNLPESIAYVMVCVFEIEMGGRGLAINYYHFSATGPNRTLLKSDGK